MTLSRKGKVFIITGAASGIGRAVAQKLDTLGAILCLYDIQPPNLQETLHHLTSPALHSTYTCDVSSSEACTAVAAFVYEKHNRIDGLLNCAGINPSSLPLAETNDAYIAKIINTNLIGTIYMSRACFPFIPSGGVILNISSELGLRGAGGMSIYCAAKFGVVGFTKALALEVGEKGVRVNAVAPGPIDTPTMLGNVVGVDYNKRVAERIGLRRVGRPEEVASVVAFV
ncbi:hypothetical protein BDV12DRAFT_198360 [Aspergillus spectabilis]